MTDIHIRATTPADAQALQAIVADGYAQTLQLPHTSIELWEKRLSEHTLGENGWSLAAEIEDEVVGHIVLMRETNPRRLHAAGIGMGVKAEFRGQGVGAALFSAVLDLADNWLNLKRIELTVYTDNEAAIALYKKKGFMIEGEFHAYAFRDGQFVNAYSMARVKP